MQGRFSLQYSFDLIFALMAAIAALAVLQTFIIGRHYIIPSTILVATVLLGNIAWYGLRDARWAKFLLFWSGFLFTAHLLFALFFAQVYRTLLGAAFEPVCAVLLLLFAFMTWQYAKRNRLFS